MLAIHFISWQPYKLLANKGKSYDGGRFFDQNAKSDARQHDTCGSFLFVHREVLLLTATGSKLIVCCLYSRHQFQQWFFRCGAANNILFCFAVLAANNNHVDANQHDTYVSFWFIQTEVLLLKATEAKSYLCFCLSE